MLTGDKLETAENIGESCRLLKRDQNPQKDMHIYRLSTENNVQDFCNEKTVQKNISMINDNKLRGLLVEA